MNRFVGVALSERSDFIKIKTVKNTARLTWNGGHDEDEIEVLVGFKS